MQPATEAHPPPGGHTRYTLCGEPVAEARIAQDLSRLTTGIDSELGEEIRALLLSGPFARAEGGVAYRDGEPHACAPGYELLALFRTRPERYAARLDAMAATWSRMLHARVAIRAFSTAELALVAPTRFWFFAGRGWLIALLGDPALSLAIPRREPLDLRWQEAPLALSEGMLGLALSELTSGAHGDGAIACMHGAVLACGDWLLLRRGQYADTFAARAEALDAIHASAALRAAYRDAIRHCSRPDAWTPECGDLQSWYAALRRTLADAIVHAEGERLGDARSLIGYLKHDAPLFAPPEPATRSTIRRVLAAMPLTAGREPWRSRPGERLLRATVALALAPYAPDCRSCAAEQLGLAGDAASDSALAAGLRALAAEALPTARLEHPFGNAALDPVARGR